MTEQPPYSEEEASGVFQQPTFNARERLICSHLIECINARPLDSILHTCQAALLLNGDSSKLLELDRDKVVGVHTVAYRLANPSTEKRQETTIYRLSLRTVNHENYVKPWFKENVNINVTENEYNYYAKNKISLTPEEQFLWITDRLTEKGYHTLVGDFLYWAMPMIQDIGGKLATTISPDTYVELFKVMRREHQSK